MRRGYNSKLTRPSTTQGIESSTCPGSGLAARLTSLDRSKVCQRTAQVCTHRCVLRTLCLSCCISLSLCHVNCTDTADATITMSACTKKHTSTTKVMCACLKLNEKHVGSENCLPTHTPPHATHHHHQTTPEITPPCTLNKRLNDTKNCAALLHATCCPSTQPHMQASCVRAKRNQESC